MSFIDPNLPISRDNLEEAVERMALACARGPVQHATILEMIELGYMPLDWKELPYIEMRYGTPTKKQIRMYGTHNLSGESWRGIRNRLRQAGFRFEQERDKILMYWEPKS